MCRMEYRVRTERANMHYHVYSARPENGTPGVELLQTVLRNLREIVYALCLGHIKGFCDVYACPGAHSGRASTDGNVLNCRMALVEGL